MRRREKVNSASALLASLPRIVCATRLSLRALMRSPRKKAEASVSSRRRSAVGLPISGPSRPLVAGVAIEGPGRRELAEFVADHIFGHQHRDEFVAVIDAEGQPDELREDGRPARPGADHLVATRGARLLGFLQQIAVDKGTFPYRAGHALSPVLAHRVDWRRRMISRSVALLCRVFLPLVGLPHGVTGWRPPEVLPSPPPCG